LLSTLCCRYIFDVETGRSFFLTAVIYTNSNGVLNDDRYEYEFADRTLADLAEVLGRALWQVPDSSATLSSPRDCTPSSLWPICTKPLTIPICIDSSVNTQETEESKVPVEKTHGVEQLETELTLTSSAEDRSLALHHSHVERVPLELPTNLVAPEEGCLACTTAKQSNSVCSTLLQHGADEPVQMDTTNFPTVADQHSYPSRRLLPIPMTQLSTLEVVTASPCSNSLKNNIKPCYKYFLDE
jgi:hypothetical protein